MVAVAGEYLSVWHTVWVALRLIARGLPFSLMSTCVSFLNVSVSLFILLLYTMAFTFCGMYAKASYLLRRREPPTLTCLQPPQLPQVSGRSDIGPLTSLALQPLTRECGGGASACEGHPSQHT